MSVSLRLRFRVLTRDKYTCQYCGKRAPDVVLHVDHVLPKSRGGRDEIGNLKTACRDCNLGKSDMRNHEQIVESICAADQAHTDKIMQWYAEHAELAKEYVDPTVADISLDAFMILVGSPMRHPTPVIPLAEEQ